MTARKLTTIGGVGAVCIALGAAGAYIGDAASSPSATSAAPAQASKASSKGKRRGPLRRLRRAVHADLVVAAPGGRFVNVTVDRGTVQQVGGSSITLKEGTKTATYRTVTLDLPANAVVRINRQAGRLSDVRSGQKAMVVKAPNRTLVIVRNAKKG
jgi:hypothetical protein